MCKPPPPHVSRDRKTDMIFEVAPSVTNLKNDNATKREIKRLFPVARQMFSIVYTYYYTLVTMAVGVVKKLRQAG